MTAAWIRGLRRWVWSLAHNGPRWTLRHVKAFGGLR